MKTIGKNGKPMINVYVVWSWYGPIMTTRLQYEDEPEVRDAMTKWSIDHWVNQAYDKEFDVGTFDGRYELAAIFTADEINFVY